MSNIYSSHEFSWDIIYRSKSELDLNDENDLNAWLSKDDILAINLGHLSYLRVILCHYTNISMSFAFDAKVWHDLQNSHYKMSVTGNRVMAIYVRYLHKTHNISQHIITKDVHGLLTAYVRYNWFNSHSCESLQINRGFKLIKMSWYRTLLVALCKSIHACGNVWIQVSRKYMSHIWYKIW